MNPQTHKPTVTHTPTPWHVNDLRTIEGEYMVCGGEGQGYGLIATVTEREDAERIVRDHKAVPTLVELLEDAGNALTDLVGTYCDLANSGDAGFWNPELVEEVKHARSAITKIETALKELRNE